VDGAGAGPLSAVADADRPMGQVPPTPAAGRVVVVRDPGDPRLADYAALTDAALRKRYEHRAGVLIAEGPNPVRALVASRYPVRSLLVAEERLGEVTDIVERIDAPVYVVHRRVLDQVVRFRLHQGVIACGERLPPPELGGLLEGSRRLVVLDGLNDHENLGALFRSARAFGIDAVLLGPGCADPLYRRSVRVSMGHVLHVAHTRTPALDVTFGLLADRGFVTVALTPDPTADALSPADAPAGRVALVLGPEGPGSSPETLAAANRRVRIPMVDEVDSLNVAAAGAIAFHWLTTGAGRRPMPH